VLGRFAARQARERAAVRFCANGPEHRGGVA
jgi:hypothetical protein